MTHDRWQLNSLYKGFDDPQFASDLDRAIALPTLLKTVAEERFNGTNTPIEELHDYLDRTEETRRLYGRLFAYCHLRFSADTSDEEAIAHISRLEALSSELTPYAVAFEKWTLTLEADDFLALIEGDARLKEHRFYLERIRQQATHRLSEAEEILMARLQNTGSQAWETLQNRLNADLTVPITLDGEKKELPLMVVRNMAYESDPQRRKNAYQAEIDAYQATAPFSALALSSIKGEVLTTSAARHFETPLEESLFYSRLSKESLDAMLEAMKDALPHFRRYLKAKARYLGHESGLPFYDLFAPVGDTDRRFSIDEARTLIRDVFAGFSSELSDFSEMAFEKAWIDVSPRKGKRGGAFCYNLPYIEESRFLLNFTGSLSDVLTTAHELGHGYHGHRIAEESLLNTSYPMPLAETASIFCETLVKNTLLKKATGDERRYLLESGLQGQIQVIVDIYSRYLFESELFDRRKEGALSADTLNAMMLEAQDRAYGDGLDPAVRHPHMWQNKPHYYSAGQNFYNFPYAFGLLFAKGLYARYLEEGEAFVDRYDELLRYTGKATIEEVTASVGIDVTSRDFWDRSLQLVIDEIDAFIDLVD